jgi:lysophospholipase L1-like esterase
LYKDSPTKKIFLELARAPVPRPESRQPATWLQSALKRPNVSALRQNTFRDLERPDIFFDGLHFNKVGRGLFSERIAKLIPPLAGIN